MLLEVNCVLLDQRDAQHVSDMPWRLTSSAILYILAALSLAGSRSDPMT